MKRALFVERWVAETVVAFFFTGAPTKFSSHLNSLHFNDTSSATSTTSLLKLSVFPFLSSAAPMIRRGRKTAAKSNSRRPGTSFLESSRTRCHLPQNARQMSLEETRVNGSARFCGLLRLRPGFFREGLRSWHV